MTYLEPTESSTEVFNPLEDYIAKTEYVDLIELDEVKVI